MPDSLTRRHFLIRGSIVLAGAGVASCTWQPEQSQAGQAALGATATGPALRFGLVTDIHYAEKNTAGTRVYRDSLDKMKTAVAALNDTAQKDAVGLAFAVTLGDMIDTPDAAAMTPEYIAVETGYLKTINAEWAKVTAPRHYVLGNHCVYTLTKEEFFAATQARPAPYSFDLPLKPGSGSVHFVVLDACFKADGTPYGRRNADWRDTNIPENELQWLANDLAQTKNPTVILAHQRLDGASDALDSNVKNHAAVRNVLEQSGRVLAVFAGHSHQNYLATVNGIPYCVFRAMVEDPGAANNAFCTVEVFPDHSIAVRGNFRQMSYDHLSPVKAAAPPV